MGLIFDGKVPSVEQTFLDRAVHGLLKTLLDTLFLTQRQAIDWLWNCPGPGYLGHRINPEMTIHSRHRFREIAGGSLLQLEQSGFIARANVERLPPVTIGESAVFRHDMLSKGSSPPGIDESDRYADVARRRVPPLDLHKPSKLFFALDRCCELLEGKFREGDAPPSRFRAREDKFKEMLDRHRTVETRYNPSPYDISATDLTATFNLNQLLLMEPYRPETMLTDRSYRARGLLGSGNPDAQIKTSHGEEVALFFLRPLSPEQICEQVKQYRSTHSDVLTEGWWM